VFCFLSLLNNCDQIQAVPFHTHKQIQSLNVNIIKNEQKHTSIHYLKQKKRLNLTSRKGNQDGRDQKQKTKFFFLVFFFCKKKIILKKQVSIDILHSI
jgi:hypothetical protein